MPCGGHLPANGWLSSPSYPHRHDGGLDCVWDVTAPPGHLVFLTVVDLDLYISSLCYYEYLVVGNTQTWQRNITMCHASNVERTIISASNVLWVFYHTTYSSMKRGFNITFTSQGKTVCQLGCVEHLQKLNISIR